MLRLARGMPRRRVHRVVLRTSRLIRAINLAGVQEATGHSRVQAVVGQVGEVRGLREPGGHLSEDRVWRRRYFPICMSDTFLSPKEG